MESTGAEKAKKGKLAREGGEKGTSLRGGVDLDTPCQVGLPSNVYGQSGRVKEEGKSWVRLPREGIKAGGEC